MAVVLNLGYHFVRSSSAPGLNTSPERLFSTIDLLKERGFMFLTCKEAIRLHLKGRLPARIVTLSFDDGLCDQYTTAFPILREMGVPATLFIITCTLEGKFPPVIGFQVLISCVGARRLEQEILPEVLSGTPYATLLDPTAYDIQDAKRGEPEEMRRIKWVLNYFPSAAFKRDLVDQMFLSCFGEGAQERMVNEWFISADGLREMSTYGIEIAAHSVSHHLFNISGLDEIDREARLSKEHLEMLGVGEVVTFGWPFGGVFSEAVQGRVAKYFESGWNFWDQQHMPENPFANLMDVPRLNEALAVLP